MAHHLPDYHLYRMKRLYAFDFDGTLTTHDTLLAFIRYACGTKAFIIGFLRHAPLLILMKIGFYPNGKAKQRIFAHFFQGWSETTFLDTCQRFAKERHNLLRPQAKAELDRLAKQGEQIVIVSASVDLWVAPFFDAYKDSACRPCILGTQIEIVHGTVTGRFTSPNCYGAEKVRRLTERFPDRTQYKLFAYGDSQGDQPLLNYADEGFYKPFR